MNRWENSSDTGADKTSVTRFDRCKNEDIPHQCIVIIHPTYAIIYVDIEILTQWSLISQTQLQTNGK